MVIETRADRGGARWRWRGGTVDGVVEIGQKWTSGEGITPS
jgi:hypothetical protein